MTKPLIKIDIRGTEKRLKKHLKQRMLDVVIMLESSVKLSLGISNNKGKNPSAEYTTPHAGTGALRRSITHAVGMINKDIVGVYGVGRGPASKYARRLELGFTGTVAVKAHTRKTKSGVVSVKAYSAVVDQAPRPYLVPAYRLNKRNIKRILTR